MIDETIKTEDIKEIVVGHKPYKAWKHVPLKPNLFHKEQPRICEMCGSIMYHDDRYCTVCGKHPMLYGDMEDMIYE